MCGRKRRRKCLMLNDDVNDISQGRAIVQRKLWTLRKQDIFIV